MAGIRIQNVSVDYPVEGRGLRRILNGIDLEIVAGEFVSIVGQTGCGKSTLLRLILGEELPTAGQILVNGRTRRQPDRTCGYVPQRYSLFPDKTVLANITFGLEVSEFGPLSLLSPARPKRMREFRAEALRYLRRTGLNEADGAQISSSALGRHAAACGHRSGADPEAARSFDG